MTFKYIIRRCRWAYSFTQIIVVDIIQLLQEAIMKDIIKDLFDRGMLDNFSDREKIEKMMETKQTIYCGFDPSAASMQLGNFVMITVLRRIQEAGHKIIAVIGGGTGMIGDPSGKKSERSFLSGEKVMQNVEGIKAQLCKYLDFSDPDKGIFVNNYDWWSKISVIEYLRDFGKSFPINYMLSKEIVSSRLESGISYTEFSYMILQSGDFYKLHKEYGCNLQIGGGDQWGNLTSSLELIRKKEGVSAEAEVFSVKLITDSDGRKFGKSERGALYLNREMTSPYFIYQYFINVGDADVGRYLKIFDDRPIEELDMIVNEHMKKPEARIGQKELAFSIVTRVHSIEVAKECVQMTEALFKDDFNGLTAHQLMEVSEGIKTVEIEEDIKIIDALTLLGLASSRREAREFLKAGGIKINGEKESDENAVLSLDKALDGGYFFIKRGKKNYAAIKHN